MKRILLYVLVLAAATAVTACGPVIPEDSFEPDYIDLPTAAYFPTVNNIPANNALTAQGVKLGRALFYDTRLSGGEVSCASCHRQDRGFDGETSVRGRVPLPLINVAYNLKNWGWTGEMAYRNGQNLEDFIRVTLRDSVELLYTSDSALLARFADNEEYAALFKAAFGSTAVTVDRMSLALAQFVRILVSKDSRFDRYMRGEETLTDEELKGYALFTTEEGADCFHCHGGAGNVLFSTYNMENNGLDEPNAVSGADAARAAYRVPTLRNIGRTAPYMHDGRYKTLDEVIDFYSEGVHASPQISPLMHHASEGGVQLTPSEKRSLKAFLLTLDDEVFLTNPEFASPFNASAK